MYVYYYQIDGKIYFTTCRGVVPGRLSPVWDMASASAWLIPGTYREEDEQ
jgi:hypothetical protein